MQSNDPPYPTDTPSHPAGDRATSLGDVPPALLDDIAQRLRGACAHLDPDAFAALVLQIARTKLRFARRAASIPGFSGLWDPPRDEKAEGSR